MVSGLFENYALSTQNENWEKHIERHYDMYDRQNDIRSPYERDYTRILHSLAYRRLKHKTQGCVVKIADKIAYLGRDIEDATIKPSGCWSDDNPDNRDQSSGLLLKHLLLALFGVI